MSHVKIISEVFSRASFQKIYDLVVHQCRKITSYQDTDFQRTAVHNHPTLTSIHNQITPFACEIFGEEVKPSYVFASNYLQGGICPLHIDRPQCYRTEPWTDEKLNNYIGSTFLPIDTDLSQFSDNWESVVLQPNQAVCYSGTHSWHLRPRVSSGRVDLVFFHFVPKDFVDDLR
jgi:hypothetical protein